MIKPPDHRLWTLLRPGQYQRVSCPGRPPPGAARRLKHSRGKPTRLAEAELEKLALARARLGPRRLAGVAVVVLRRQRCTHAVVHRQLPSLLGPQIPDGTDALAHRYRRIPSPRTTIVQLAAPFSQYPRFHVL